MDRSYSLLVRSLFVGAAIAATVALVSVNGRAAETGTELGQTLGGEPCRLVAGSSIVCAE